MHATAAADFLILLSGDDQFKYFLRCCLHERVAPDLAAMLGFFNRPPAHPSRGPG